MRPLRRDGMQLYGLANKLACQPNDLGVICFCPVAIFFKSSDAIDTVHETRAIELNLN